MTAWEELRETCLKCQACQLRQTCTQVVFGVGDPNAEVLFIGEALKVFTEVTGRACLIPSAEVSFDLTKIFDAGYSIDDVRMVCEQQQAEWGADPKRQKWLRPHTLFGEKFEGYLAAAKAGTAKEERDAAAKFADAI